jgi:hypothetical protein
MGTSTTVPRPSHAPPHPTRSGSFEVYVDGKYLAYSKLKARAFPDFNRIAGEQPRASDSECAERDAAATQHTLSCRSTIR